MLVSRSFTFFLSEQNRTFSLLQLRSPVILTYELKCKHKITSYKTKRGHHVLPVNWINNLYKHRRERTCLRGSPPIGVPGPRYKLLFVRFRWLSGHRMGKCAHSVNRMFLFVLCLIVVTPFFQRF